MSSIVGDGSVYTCKHLMRVKRAEDCVFCHRDQLLLQLDAAHRAQRQAEAETGRALAAHAIEAAQLRGNLSVAEEGLANAAQEIENAQHDIERLMAACTSGTNEVHRLRNDLTACQLERDEARRILAEATCGDVTLVCPNCRPDKPTPQSGDHG